jgi:hypothetical protein
LVVFVSAVAGGITAGSDEFGMNLDFYLSLFAVFAVHRDLL